MAPPLSGPVNSLLERLKDALGGTEEVPDGWLTMPEMCAKFDLSENSTRKLIRNGVAKGILEVRKFRIPDRNGHRVQIVHYREIQS